MKIWIVTYFAVHVKYAYKNHAGYLTEYIYPVVLDIHD